MFRKLKQRIEQEASPTPKEASSEAKEAPSEAIDTSSEAIDTSSVTTARSTAVKELFTDATQLASAPNDELSQDVPEANTSAASSRQNESVNGAGTGPLAETVSNSTDEDSCLEGTGKSSDAVDGGDVDVCTRTGVGRVTNKNAEAVTDNGVAAETGYAIVGSVDNDAVSVANPVTDNVPPVSSGGISSHTTGSQADDVGSVAQPNAATTAADIPPDSDSQLSDGATPRRMNLAATVLLYGEEISAKNETIAGLEKQLLAMQSEGVVKPNQQVGELRNRLVQSERQVETMHQTIQSHEKTISNLEKSISSLQHSEASHKSVVSALEGRLAQKEAEMSELTDKLRKQSDEEASLESVINLLRSQIVTLEGELRAKEVQQRQISSSQSHSEPANNSGAEVSQLKTKLTRAHSHTKQLEKLIHERDAELSSLVMENKYVKSSLESSKQQALDELLTVSKEESELRTELSAHVQKLSSLQAQYKSQSRLLSDKQKDMTILEQSLDKQLKNNKKEREVLVSNHTKQVTELESSCESLRLTLAAETQASAKVKEQLDSLREETLDKQLDDEKQLTDLHEQLSGLRGELRQLERSKKRDVEALNSDKSARDETISKLESRLSQAESGHKEQTQLLTTQIDKLRTELETLKGHHSDVNSNLTETQHRLETAESERDELYLRNANLSSKLETCKVELKSALSDHEEQVKNHRQQLLSHEEEEKSSAGKLDALQEKITLLEEQVHTADGVGRELEQRVQEIGSLNERLSDQEKMIADKTKALKMQQQTINDLKKTIKRELKGLGDSNPHLPSLGDMAAGRSQDPMDRVRSSPALSDLDRYDSSVEDNIPPLAGKHLRLPLPPDIATVAQNPPLAQQHRHEVNGFCGHKDINFEYLKNVVFSFLVSRDRESLHLVKALAVLLEFTPVEERLLKETVEWKLSWWPASKKPSKRHRK